MQIIFDKEYLNELYFTGKCNDKKYRFQPQIIKKYKTQVDILAACSKMEDLYRFKSLHFEALRGDKAGLYSVRVNDQYRIELRLDTSATEPIMTICTIVELSNHYK